MSISPSLGGNSCQFPVNSPVLPGGGVVGGIIDRFISSLYYDVQQLVSMDTTVPLVYGSYTLEHSCHIPEA